LARNFQASLQDYRQQAKKSKIFPIALHSRATRKRSFSAIDNLTERSYFFPMCKAIETMEEMGLNILPGLIGMPHYRSKHKYNKGQKGYRLIKARKVSPQTGGKRD
jgi:hypothetical protein